MGKVSNVKGNYKTECLGIQVTQNMKLKSCKKKTQQVLVGGLEYKMQHFSNLEKRKKKKNNFAYTLNLSVCLVFFAGICIQVIMTF